jgi:beta-galactosidase
VETPKRYSGEHIPFHPYIDLRDSYGIVSNTPHQPPYHPMNAPSITSPKKQIPSSKVVAFDDKGKAVAEKEIHTAGVPHHLELTADRKTITADGKDLSFVTVSVVDKNGIACPNAANRLNFKVAGAGKFKAVCNGDPTSLEMFHLPTMKAFSGKLVVIVQSSETSGDIKLEVTTKGMKTAAISLSSK